MDKTIVPTNLLSWPKVKNLIPDHKLIVLALWQNPFVTPCGTYFIDLDMFAGMLGFNKLNVEQAIYDFEEKGILRFDTDTSEILICDWWRFHKCESPSQINMTQRAVDKIQSEVLKTEFFNRIKHVSNKIIDLRSNHNTTEQNFNGTQPQQPTSEDVGFDSTTSQSSSSGSDLIFPKMIDPRLIPAIRALIQHLPNAQDYLHELGAAVEQRRIKTDIVPYMAGMVKNRLYRTNKGFAKQDQLQQKSGATA